MAIIIVYLVRVQSTYTSTAADRDAAARTSNNTRRSVRIMYAPTTREQVSTIRR